MSSMPLTLQNDPPPSPPTVSIRSSTASERVVIGQLLMAEGFEVGDLTMPAAPPKWPQQEVVPAPDRVLIDTLTRPRAVTIKVFEAVPDGVGEPQSSPIASQDCWLEDLDSPSCDLKTSTTDMNQSIKMPELSPGTYSTTVYVAWPKATPGKIETTSASWLFTLRVT